MDQDTSARDLRAELNEVERDLENLRKNAASVRADVGEADLHRLMYSSGTTAHPKGVPITYGNFYWKTIGHVAEFGISAADRTAMAGPMYHVGAFDLPGIGTWWVGGSLIVALTMQPLLFIVALKAYMGLPRLPGAGLRLLADSAYGFLLFAVFLVYSPLPRYIAERNFPSGLIAIGFIVLGVLATYLIFRKTSGAVIIDRIPPFLTCAVSLLYMGLSSLPFAFKPLFTKVIGHQIHARWQEPIQNVVFVLVPIGIVWALINAAMDRQRKANLLCLVGLAIAIVFWVFLVAAFWATSSATPMGVKELRWLFVAVLAVAIFGSYHRIGIFSPPFVGGSFETTALNDY